MAPEASPPVLRRLLLRRAKYRCEYCQAPLDLWERDHQKPRVSGGCGDAPNSVASCGRCNRNKASAEAATDPVTGREWRLFNPRQDAWKDHFRTAFGTTVGTSPIGRSTAALLFRWTPSQVRRSSWHILDGIDDPDLHAWLAHQHANRLGNRFDDLEAETARAVAVRSLRRARPKDRARAERALSMLRLELFFTRSQERDILIGLRRIATFFPSVDRGLRSWARDVHSVLLQQAATKAALEGDIKRRDRLQTLAFKRLADDWQGPSEPWRNQARLLAVLTRTGAEPSIPAGLVQRAVEDAGADEVRTLSYLADSAIYSKRRHPDVDQIATALNHQMGRCGYGQDFDVAQGVSFRRRWWGIRALTERRLDLDVLSADLSFWRRMSMTHELREVRQMFAVIAGHGHRSAHAAQQLLGRVQ